MEVIKEVHVIKEVGVPVEVVKEVPVIKEVEVTKLVETEVIFSGPENLALLNGLYAVCLRVCYVTHTHNVFHEGAKDRVSRP